MAGIDYDFQVFDNPNELRSRIEALNEKSNGARMLAGYCWDWNGRNDSTIYDVTIPHHNFAMRWNLSDDGPSWIMKPNSVSEIGCIHTSQGLELEYVGVIFGRDLLVRDGEIITNGLERASTDRSVFGLVTPLRNGSVEAQEIAERIIKNTYRTLMTRGQKGCYVYSVDEETNEYFKRAMSEI